MNEFMEELERMRTACQLLPPDFGRGTDVDEKTAMIAVIEQVKAALDKARYLLHDM